MVDFPDAERPVNQMVKPGCLRYLFRSSREREGCQVMLLAGCQYACSQVLWQMVGWWGLVGGTHVAILLSFWEN